VFVPRFPQRPKRRDASAPRDFSCREGKRGGACEIAEFFGGGNFWKQAKFLGPAP